MLAEAIGSVKAQTFQDYEIIVVSNGESPEMRRASRAAAATFNAHYIELPKGNISAARNFGIKRANGEWIAFLDDDDLWDSTKLERQLAEAERTGADMVACDHVEFFVDGRETFRKPRLLDGGTHTKALNHLSWWAAPSAVIVRKRVLDEIGGFDPRLRWTEDNDLWRRISWRHTIHQVEVVLTRIRRGHLSQMHPCNDRRRYIHELRLFAKMYRDTPHDLRSALPGTTFVSRRLMIICFPRWLQRRLELYPWSGAQWRRLWESAIAQWHQLWPRASAKPPRNDGPIIWALRHPRKALVRALALH